MITLYRSLFREIVYKNGIKILDKEEIRVEDVIVALNEPYKRIIVDEDVIEKIGKFPNEEKDLKV